jgi:hypothetical protein
LMSYWNGLFLSSPKLASIEGTPHMYVTAGKRWSTDGKIEICRPFKLFILIMTIFEKSSIEINTHQNAIQREENCQFVPWVYHKATPIDIRTVGFHFRSNGSVRKL